jgi:kinesin family protein 6/9
VDLAGSERLEKTASVGSVRREAQAINKSLSFLEQVVVALLEKGRDHVPYRQSKLTHMLKDALGGHCRTRMIACVWSDADHVDETLSTLRFATRMMRVKTTPVRDVALGEALLSEAE